MLSIYIDPQQLGTPDPLFDEIRRYVDFVRSSRPLDASRPVMVPGEVEDQNRATQRDGLDLDETSWAQLVDAAKSAGVSDDLIEAAVTN